MLSAVLLCALWLFSFYFAGAASPNALHFPDLDTPMHMGGMGMGFVGSDPTTLRLDLDYFGGLSYFVDVCSLSFFLTLKWCRYAVRSV